MTSAPYMMTRSGRRFYFGNPVPSEILLSDIAFALWHLNRFIGHVGPYNVAMHSVNVLHCALGLGADRETARAALMHDAHEAFVGDISSPLKAAIGFDFQVIDHRAARAVSIRFGLDNVDHAIVHAADRMVTHAEALHFMGDAAKVWATDPWGSFDPAKYQGPDYFSSYCKGWGIE